MKLLPIESDESLNAAFTSIPECVDILQVYPNYYKVIGFVKPWIGYFAADDNGTIIGCGGYKGRPHHGSIEIAYATFENFKRQGVATQICGLLVQLSLQTDPSVRITARTLPENNESTRVLKRNGFEFNGVVWDEDDGNVWEWVYLVNR